MSTAEAFIRRSRFYLREEYLPKIRHALEGLSPEQLWWRPNESSNSIANLLLHLAGNIRQWVVCGIGGAPDRRNRDEEFRSRGGAAAQELLGELGAAVEEVDAVLASLSPDVLSEPRTIQGFPVTVLDALYHVVEHFSMHTGQILLLSKQLTGRDLGFYRVQEDGGLKPHW